MPEFALECDVSQGFDYQPGEYHTTGYLTKLQIGGTSIAADLKVTLPPTSGSSLSMTPVVAVLAGVEWSTRPEDTITLTGRVSGTDAHQLRVLTTQNLRTPIVTVGLVVYRYDHDRATYYHAFETHLGVSPTATVSAVGAPGISYALLAETGVDIGTRPEPDGTVTVELSLAPPVALRPQQILTQSSATTKVIRPWGVAAR